MVDRAKDALYSMSDANIESDMSFDDLVVLAAEQLVLAKKLTRSCTHLFVRGVGDEDQNEAAQNMRELADHVEPSYAQADAYKNIDAEEVDPNDQVELFHMLRKARTQVRLVEPTYRVHFAAVREMRIFNPAFSNNLSGIDGNA